MVVYGNRSSRAFNGVRGKGPYVMNRFEGSNSGYLMPVSLRNQYIEEEGRSSPLPDVSAIPLSSWYVSSPLHTFADGISRLPLDSSNRYIMWKCKHQQIASLQSTQSFPGGEVTSPEIYPNPAPHSTQSKHSSRSSMRMVSKQICERRLSVRRSAR